MIIFEGIDNFKKLFTRENYFNWRGRVDRRTFWTTWLICFLVALALDIAFGAELSGLFGVLEFVIAIPMVCLEIRRLHDTGHSGKLVLWEFILCVLGMAFIFFSLGFFSVDSFKTGLYGIDGDEFAGAYVMIILGFLCFVAAFVLDIVILVFLCMRTKVFDGRELMSIEDKSDGESGVETNDPDKSDAVDDTSDRN